MLINTTTVNKTQDFYGLDYVNNYTKKHKQPSQCSSVTLLQVLEEDATVSSEEGSKDERFHSHELD